MSAPVGGIEKTRAHVAWLWYGLGGIARLPRVLWPWRSSEGHIAAAQFELELERARRANEEKGGRA